MTTIFLFLRLTVYVGDRVVKKNDKNEKDKTYLIKCDDDSREISVEKLEDEAFLTIFIDKEVDEEKINENPEQTAINQLAKVISYLEDRIATIENIMLDKPKKRGIKLVER